MSHIMDSFFVLFAFSSECVCVRDDENAVNIVSSVYIWYALSRHSLDFVMHASLVSFSKHTLVQTLFAGIKMHFNKYISQWQRSSRVKQHQQQLNPIQMRFKYGLLQNNTRYMVSFVRTLLCRCGAFEKRDSNRIFFLE